MYIDIYQFDTSRHLCFDHLLEIADSVVVDCTNLVESIVARSAKLPVV